MKKTDFFEAIKKISKNDKDMEMFFEKYLDLMTDSFKLFRGSFEYYKKVNYEDKELEKILIDMAKENDWLDKNNNINIGEVPEITKKYLDTKFLFLSSSEKVLDAVSKMVNIIEDLKPKLFGSYSQEIKNEVQEILKRKLYVIDLGVDCFLYLSIIRFSFNPNPTLIGYDIVKQKANLNEDDYVLNKLSTGLDIMEILTSLFFELSN